MCILDRRTGQWCCLGYVTNSHNCWCYLASLLHPCHRKNRAIILFLFWQTLDCFAKDIISVYSVKSFAYLLPQNTEKNPVWLFFLLYTHRADWLKILFLCFPVQLHQVVFLANQEVNHKWMTQRNIGQFLQINYTALIEHSSN